MFFHLSWVFLSFNVGFLQHLKNKGVLLSGIERSKEFFLFKELFLGWVWVVGEKRELFPLLFFLSHNMVT
jgi:hypothetical protein